MSGLAPLSAITQTLAPPFAIDRLLTRREKAQSDFRKLAVERLPHKISGIVNHLDDITRLRVRHIAHIAAIHPKVALSNTLRAAS